MFKQALELSQTLWSLKVFKNPLIRMDGFKSRSYLLSTFKN